MITIKHKVFLTTIFILLTTICIQYVKYTTVIEENKTLRLAIKNPDKIQLPKKKVVIEPKKVVVEETIVNKQVVAKKTTTFKGSKKVTYINQGSSTKVTDLKKLMKHRKFNLFYAYNGRSRHEVGVGYNLRTLPITIGVKYRDDNRIGIFTNFRF